MPRFRPIALLLIALSAGLAAGQRAMPTPAAANGISGERLQRLDAVLKEHIDRNRIPGIVALVLRDGKPVYERALGGATRKRTAP